MNSVLADPLFALEEALSPQEPKRFALSKSKGEKGFKVLPESQGDESYRVDVGTRRMGERPFIHLYQGSGQSTLLSAGRASTQPSFKIYQGDPNSKKEAGDSSSMPWEVMPVQTPESTWAMTFEYGDRRFFSWKRTSHVTVDGIKPSRTTHRNWKLVERGYQEDVLAVFTGNSGFSHSGALQINVHWGSQFERMVVMTIVCLLSKGKQPVKDNLVGLGVGVPSFGV